MLPLKSNRLKTYPGPPSSLKPRDWARLLHAERTQAYAEANLDSESGQQTSVVVCQFAPTEPPAGNALETADAESIGRRLVMTLGGYNEPRTSFDSLTYSFTSIPVEGELTIFTDGRIEFRSNALESDFHSETPCVMAALLYQSVLRSAHAAKAFYGQAGYDRTVFCDWTFVTRAGITLLVERRARHVTIDRSEYGQSLSDTDPVTVTEPALEAIANLTRMRGRVPEAWTRMPNG